MPCLLTLEKKIRQHKHDKQNESHDYNRDSSTKNSRSAKSLEARRRFVSFHDKLLKLGAYVLESHYSRAVRAMDICKSEQLISIE